MIVLDSIEKYNFPDPAILTIGTFDGVHLGHQKLFHSMHKVGKSLKKVVITFPISPQKQLNNEYKKIIPLEEKLDLIDKNKIDISILLDFTSVSSLSYLEFLTKIKQKINFSFLILGKDAVFGKNREGVEINIKKQEKLVGFQSIYIPKLKKGSFEISSSYIKELIKKGELSLVSQMLGRPFEIIANQNEIDLHHPFFTIKKKDIELPPEGIYLFKIDSLNTFLEGKIKKNEIEIALNDKINIDIKKSPKRIKIFRERERLSLSSLKNWFLELPKSHSSSKIIRS
jgi:riboflavin kinase / FMN adenylyltransferase